MTNETRKSAILHPSSSLGPRSSIRMHPVARSIVMGWREHVGEREPRDTLVACSGGADSVALAVTLGLDAGRERSGHRVVIAHVKHDLRERALVERDRDAVEALAGWLRVPFVERSIEVDLRMNAEASARALRYGALAEMAEASGCPFVATAHHADDELETVLMAVLRGSGPRGLRGIHPVRALDRERTLIRPMLGLTRAEVVSFLRGFGIGWEEDHTNAETDRLRARLRHEVLPGLLGVRPDAPAHATRLCARMADVTTLIDERVSSVFGDGLQWDRGAISSETDLVIGEGLRRAYDRITGGERLDSVSSEMTHSVSRAIRDGAGGVRVFEWPVGVRVVVCRDTVRMIREDL